MKYVLINLIFGKLCSPLGNVIIGDNTVAKKVTEMLRAPYPHRDGPDHTLPQNLGANV
jgi:hypothetical protein